MFRDDARDGRIESAEVEEPEWLTVDVGGVAHGNDGALPEVPIRDVVPLMAENRDVRKEPGNQVHPFLVDKESSSRVDHALKLEFFPPPRQEAGQRRLSPDREEPEIVSACLHDRALARVLVAGNEAGQVRGQRHEWWPDSRIIKLDEWAVEEDVGVQVDDSIVPGREEVREHPRLHRGVQLQEGIAETELTWIGQGQRRDRHG